MEQSHQILEERNDSYKSTAIQSQTKILRLEQDKVELTAKLSEVMSQLTSSQLALSEVKRSEQELSEQRISYECICFPVVLPLTPPP